MATLMSRLLARGDDGGNAAENRYSVDEYVALATQAMYDGNGIGPGLTTTYGDRPVERIEANFQGVVAGAYKRNGVVFACQVSRLTVFAQATFAFRQVRTTGPANLFTTPALAPLQEPWVNGSEGELLARMIQDVDNAGNAYIRKAPADSMSVNRLERLRPDWVDIVLDGDPGMVTPTVIGYLYYPGGRESGRRPVALLVDEVAHWSPYPDPIATYRGMAPLTPILREVSGDNAATDHKHEFFGRAATPNLAIRFDPSIDVDRFRKFKEAMEAEHVGVGNRWKTLYLGGGADPVSVGNSFREMDYKAIQALGETRIAAAYGVPAVIAQISEGLAGSSLNAGNFSAGRRLFADKTMRWLWKDCCAALSRIIDVPSRSQLWWDDRSVAFLREDQADAANIQSTQAQTIAALVREGFTPDSVIEAVRTEDWTLLKHTGLVSVQLLEPGAEKATPGTAPKAPTKAAPAKTTPGGDDDD